MKQSRLQFDNLSKDLIEIHWYWLIDTVDKRRMPVIY
jgi:hypothetical protein